MILILDNTVTHGYVELGHLNSDYFFRELKTPFRGVYGAKTISFLSLRGDV